jgi:hypothetical protein
MASPSVYAEASGPGSSLATSAVETCSEATSALVYTETVLMPISFAVLIIRT